MDKVAILLCCYNGEKYLEGQLDSIIRQTHKNWCLYASDDNSIDSTREFFHSEKISRTISGKGFFIQKQDKSRSLSKLPVSSFS